MAKQSQLEKAIASLNDQIKTLELARAHLLEQVKKAPARKRPRVVPKDEDAGKDSAA
jgi:hypothetical protein